MPKKDIITMPKIVYEKREFTDNVTGRPVEYEVYGISAYIDGELNELRLKLTPAEKLAWKMIMSGTDKPIVNTVEPPLKEPVKVTIKPQEDKIELDSEDEQDENWLDD